MRRLQLLALSVLPLCQPIRADEAQVVWFYPVRNSDTPQETWYLGEIKELNWDTNEPEYNIYLQQNRALQATGSAIIFRQFTEHLAWLIHGADEVCLGKEELNNAVKKMNWTVQRYNFDFTSTTEFYLVIADLKGNTTTSEYMTILPTYKVTPPTTQNTTTCTTNNGTTVSGDGKVKTVGIGLGIGLGIPLVAALGTIVFLTNHLRQTRRAQAPSSYSTEQVITATTKENDDPQVRYQDIASQPQVFEASGRGSIHEAPNNGIIHR
ncbi:hypothetical protein Vi05172_g9161 [Venturia inaequalis]|nr:hypothetical protein Vi05172_g9161 [Venturia inaequalis]